MRTVNKIMSVLLIACMAAFGLYPILRTPAEFSPTERRPLKQAPDFSAEAFFSGDYAEKSAAFLLDQTAGRDFWLSLKGETQYRAGAGDNGRIYFADKDYMMEMQREISGERLERNISDFIAFKQKYFPGEEKPAALLLLPSAAGVYPELLPPAAPEAPQSPLLRAAKRQAEAGGLIFPRVYERLISAKSGSDQLYFRTDHHWTQHGAAKAADAWRQALKKEDPQKDYRVALQSKDFAGTTLAKGKRFFYTPDRIESYIARSQDAICLYDAEGELLRKGIYDPEALKGYDQYTYFTGDNRDFLRIETGEHSGGHLLLIKDSYANALIPFLCPYFERITVVDLRYYGESMEELMARGPYDELLFVYNVVTLAEDNNTFKLLN